MPLKISLIKKLFNILFFIFFINLLITRKIIRKDTEKTIKNIKNNHFTPSAKLYKANSPNPSYIINFVYFYSEYKVLIIKNYKIR